VQANAYLLLLSLAQSLAALPAFAHKRAVQLHSEVHALHKTLQGGQAAMRIAVGKN